MASEKIAPEAPVTTATTGVDVPADTKVFSSDIKPADPEGNNAPASAPGELKRQLKSRHLQMIAIGMPRGIHLLALIFANELFPGGTIGTGEQRNSRSRIDGNL